MSRRTKFSKTYGGLWTYKELMNLAAGIQTYGFRDTDKISSLIKTKSPTAVKKYINRRISETKKANNKLEEKITGCKIKRSWTATNNKAAKNWRPIRKWKKIAENQMPKSAVKQDYSRIIIKDLCEKFYEEAKETTNPQVLDVKALYKFMLECVSGEIPSHLPIKESAYILVLLRFMKDVFENGDFKEEFEFLHNFRRATQFVPAQEKDDSRKNVSYEPGTVPIPKDLYEMLTHHKQVVYSMNPLGVPGWLLEKEQKYLNERLEFRGNSDQPSTSGKSNKL